MAFVVKTARTLRSHWKKSIFFSGLTVYGVKYAINKHNDNLLRRQYCEEARGYGNASIELGHRPRRLTVFLNPAANGGKGKKMFEKTAAPILYLAGIEVNVVATEYEGQVKNFMTVLDTKDTDAVVVAGGNGTLIEAVTGFLRKEDNRFSNAIPLGVIPIGQSNRFFKVLFGDDLDEVKAVAEAAIAVVRALTKKVDVIKFDGGVGKTIYAMTGLEVGAYRDAAMNKQKYWYFGPLKSRWTYLRRAMKEWPPSFKASMSYIEATEQNVAYEDEETTPPASAGKFRWSFVDFLFGRKQRSQIKVEERKARLEEREKEEEMHRIHTDISTLELTVSPTAQVDQSVPMKALQVSVGPSEPTKTQFISEGWSRINRSQLKMGSEEDNKMVVKKVHIEPKEEEQWYNIDGEAFEAMPVDISVMRNKLMFFCPKERTDRR